MPPRHLVPLLRLISRLGLASGRSSKTLLAAALSFIRKLATHRHVAELFRFMFLGTILETGRKVVQKIADWATDFFVVKAEFAMGDFAYDWVISYLEHHRLWNESRSFKVVAQNTNSRPDQSSHLGKIDGYPDPVYVATTDQSPSLFCWRGYWMSITKFGFDTGMLDGGGGCLVIALWSRDRRVLDEFVLAAREFYAKAQPLPRTQTNSQSEPSGALLTAHFDQSDVAYNWMLEYLRSSDALKDVMEYDVSTKQSDVGWATSPKDFFQYIPSPHAVQLFHFTSPRTGRSTWLQVGVPQGIRGSAPTYGETITIILHSSDRDVLTDLIECARERYTENGTSRVTVHLTDSDGRWARTVVKSRRALSTLILPPNIKEMLVADAREFLESEHWYSLAGIPHHRGYLLYGAPGTGKSSTIHALAGELGLSIYFISLATPGINDYTLGRLISSTPSRCILMLEDIDCAFPSREELGQDEDYPEMAHMAPRPHVLLPPRSAVTLAGLLNVLDSVISGEGRLTFATTNHIGNLDPALIREGRMDLKIQYGLATTEQIREVFKVFFPLTEEEAKRESWNDDDLDRRASEFAAAIPSETYSIAQIQGYLVRKKKDRTGAIEGVNDWMAAQAADRRVLAESKRQWRADMAKWQQQAFQPPPGPPQPVNPLEGLHGGMDQPGMGAAGDSDSVEDAHDDGGYENDTE
ncbi:hypothetical protein FB451DRAFT_1240375 [Mycena latifolia]|nr:hypothetical protein FB451DRAFT_1240375 [Mycena latifolia]